MTTNSQNLPQLLKWIGNKHRFAKEIVQYMPQKIDTYFEPFLGSGAVLATLSDMKFNSLTPTTSYNQAIGSDALKPLIQIFDYVKKEPETLINYYRKHIENYNEDRENNYLSIRENFNRSRNPLDFALLTRTCYSGIIRFRKSDGYMSTPIGPHNPISPEEFEKRVMIWHHLLQNTLFLHSDFRQTMRMAGEGDLIYCDPPYTHSQTIIYGAQSFHINDLFEEINNCKQRGVKVMLSINGKKKSGKEDIGVEPPTGLFEREILVNCGVSMINRLQREGKKMIEENVYDKLLLTW